MAAAVDAKELPIVLLANLQPKSVDFIPSFTYKFIQFDKVLKMDGITPSGILMSTPEELAYSMNTDLKVRLDNRSPLCEAARRCSKGTEMTSPKRATRETVTIL